ncbi:MAG: transcription termination/antitermination protein NusA [Lachnospiraceae bacterium]|uniref:transcription termination factor NusA n=1 Tax=uncultured Acetatifactor sp. TaxID=1671927 RepID=UPI00262AE83B|nr:transcription termination factor NusA [uncultured Acetatifactor sp.]MCI8788576.1 transcription termination/antitermination protein NusA [Lachnospiraceae bacterium]
MNKELMEALDILEREKEISKETLFEAIENSLLTACKNHFGKADNVRVEIDRETCDFLVYAEKEVVPTEEEVEDNCLQISLEDAREISTRAQVGDMLHVEIKSKEFGRIATQNAKNVILQKIREEERSVIYNQYYEKEKDVVTGVVQRYLGRNISINLGKADAMLNESEQVKGEVFRPTERIKVYILEVKNTPKGPRINVSRTHPELVKRLFESEVTEIKDGTVEIKSIAREAGNRTKIAVWSNNPNVDPVGACVGMNGARVNAIVDELRGEKIDIVNWDENPGNLIQNALSPAKIVAVFADPDEKTAKVVVPDYQLSLAIGKEGQNARLAARLTGYKIDIKSETQAKDAPGFRYEDYIEEDYGDYEEYEEGILEDGEGYAEEDGQRMPEGYGEEAYGEPAGYEEDGTYEETAGYEGDGTYEEPAGYEEGGIYEESAGYEEDGTYEEPQNYDGNTVYEGPEYDEDGESETVDEE